MKTHLSFLRFFLIIQGDALKSQRNTRPHASDIGVGAKAWALLKMPLASYRESVLGILPMERMAIHPEKIEGFKR
jgi:hypothetical protein